MNNLELVVLALATALLVYSLAFLQKLRAILIYSVPAVNMLAAILVAHRFAGGFHAGHMRVVLMIGLISLMVPLLRLNLWTAPALLFVGYLLVLVPLATDPLYSLEGAMKLALGVLMLPVGYAFFQRLDQLDRLHLGISIAMALMLVNFVLAQIFKFGRSAYVDDVYVGGEGAVTMAYVFAYYLLMMPLIYRLVPAGKPIKRIVLGFLFFAALVAMAMVFRRGALLGLAFGLVVYTVLAPGHRSVRLIKLGAIAAVLFLFSSSLYVEKIQRVAVQRSSVVEFVSNTERGRMAEFGLITEMMLNGPLRQALIGSEPFNSRLYLKTRRPLHVDYMSLLQGTGLIGLSMYLLIHVAIAWGLFNSARCAVLPVSREMRDTGFALIIASLTISFSSQIYILSSLSLVFLYLGALLGVLRHAGSPPLRGSSQPVCSELLRVDAGGLRTIT